MHAVVTSAAADGGELVKAARTWSFAQTLSYTSRLLLPLGLLAAAVAAWTVAGQMETVEQVTTSEAENALTTPLVSVRRVPEFATASTRDASIAAALATLPPDPGGLSCAVVLLDGEPVLDLRGDRALEPSYAQILITGHAAIDILGAEFTYETQLLANALPDLNGRVFDGVYLVGGGDPVLRSFGYTLDFRPVRSSRSSLEDLAAAAADAGVLRIDGGVIGIDRRYDAERSLPGWPEELLTSGLVGPLSALQYNGGFTQRATANGGVAVPATEPAAFAAEAFAQELWDIDVQVFDDNRALGPDEELPSLVPIARLSSPPMRDIVFQMMATNDASAAEMILKELGLATSSVGSTQSGGRAVQAVLEQQGVDVPVPFRDGSGLDPIGGTSCNQLATAADTIPLEHPSLTVLPAYDLPGVFEGRLADLELDIDLRLVGGVHGDASGLVARTVGSTTRLSVASVINRPGGPTEDDLAYQQALVQVVSLLPSSISLDGLGPDD